ncbi:spore coat polysaccharide biosynthesis protein SpsF [Ekhidna lutea]|uniref:Spore coat polysaccharide biosynthesis protein SpsF n=1 Tax=Ekhidna lutea TaxID=447679 RepID=A0A239FIQ4_EKHLU|nr:hypothetical protein [Ekhidna lutea]SNS56173.1 spore coat polysaccharide biosynthesis protein SpsF [Ekhidna lutea]
MEDGQSNPKIGAIIQARMQSERLPGKVLMPMPFPAGPPLLSRIIESLDQISLLDEVIVATSSKRENDPIEKFCNSMDVRCFRGDENDVQSRFISIIEIYGFEHVIRLTGDNPMIDPSYLIKAIESHLSLDSDYTKTIGLPLGTNFEIVKAGCLTQRSKTHRTNSEMEHVTHWIANSDDFSKNILAFDYKEAQLRLTVDYPQDYAMISMLFALLDERVDLDRICEISNEHKWLSQINNEMEQKIA